MTDFTSHDTVIKRQETTYDREVPLRIQTAMNLPTTHWYAENVPWPKEEIISENGAILGTPWDDTRERSLQGWEGVQLAKCFHKGGPELVKKQQKMGQP